MTIYNCESINVNRKIIASIARDHIQRKLNKNELTILKTWVELALSKKIVDAVKDNCDCLQLLHVQQFIKGE